MQVLLLSIAIIVLDQITKYWVTLKFYLGESVAIIPGFFSLTYVRNTGAAWGMLGGWNGLLVGLSSVVLVTLILFRRSFLTDTPIHRVSSGLMIGGIAGNLLDRIRLHYVVDFLDFFWTSYHFPAFNVADSAICIGVGLYMLSSLLAPEKAAGGKTD
ncbi:MAG: signal peptidase II [bacterium]